MKVKWVTIMSMRDRQKDREYQDLEAICRLKTDETLGFIIWFSQTWTTEPALSLWSLLNNIASSRKSKFHTKRDFFPLQNLEFSLFSKFLHTPESKLIHFENCFYHALCFQCSENLVMPGFLSCVQVIFWTCLFMSTWNHLPAGSWQNTSPLSRESRASVDSPNCWVMEWRHWR